MDELILEYRRSLDLLETKISEIIKAKKDAEVLCQKKRIDPEIQPDIIKLDKRLKELGGLRADLKKVVKEVSSYYIKSHWRDEELTMNERKMRSQPYAPVILDEESKKEIDVVSLVNSVPKRSSRLKKQNEHKTS